MAGIRGNQGWWMAQKQGASGGKGVAVTLAAPVNSATPAIGAQRNTFSGGSIGPSRSTDRLSETDASRDQGNIFATTAGVEGSPETYARDAALGQMLHAVLGTDTVTGTSNFTHVLTPNDSLPFYNFWKGQGPGQGTGNTSLYEQYKDCKVGSLTISGEAGAPLTFSVGIQGLTSTRLAGDPLTYTAGAPNVALNNQAPYSFNDATITLNGSATALVRSFELTIENNLTVQQTDDFVPYDIVEGTREVSLSYDLIFENTDLYDAFHYNSQAAPAAQSSTVQVTPAVFTFTKTANNSISFSLPQLAYEELPVEPDPGGDPIVVSVRAVAQRGGSPVITATVKNQIALY